MSTPIQLIQLFKTLTPHIKSQKDFDDAYLANSADVYDLERRMREIDQRGQRPFCGFEYGLR